MRRFALTLAVAFGPMVQAAEWKVVDEGSSLRFIGSSQGESFDGRFDDFDADIRFDPAALAQARFDVRIDLASADTRNAERDEALLGPAFFAVDRYPRARFLAEQFDALGDGRFVAHGTLALRGVTHPVALEFRWSDGDPALLTGRATLQRLAFGVGSGDWADTDLIANEVIVETRLVLQRTD